MKKFYSIILTSFLILSCFSCSEKKKADEPEPVGEPIETVSEQPQFITYNYEDFKNIEVKVNNTDKEPPVTLKCYKFPEYDFGERIPPCMSSEDPMKYMTNKEYYDSLDDEELKKDIYENFMSKVNKPVKGRLISIQYDDDKIYQLVSYDECSREHEWSIFCCDMKTNEVSEVYNYSGIDDNNNFDIYDSKIIDNKLYITSYQNDEKGNAIENELIEINLENGESETLYKSKGYILILEVSNRELLLLENYEKDGEYLVNNYKYDTVEHKLTNFETDMDEKEQLEGVLMGKVFREGEITAYLEKPEGSRKYDLVTKLYRLKTDVSAARIVYADEKKATIITDSEQHILHTYNFEKMEHYITDVWSIADEAVAFGDGIVMSKERTDYAYNVYYFIPEYGLTYTLTESVLHDRLIKDNDTVLFSGVVNTMERHFGIDMVVDSYYDSVYWLEKKEG